MSRFKLLLAGILLFLFQNTSFASERISNLITPVSYFVDHVKQLDDLKNNLTKYRQASIVGTSGIGKTQLARTYAYENKDRYNVIWFFDCNLDMNHEFVKLAKQLNEKVNASLPEDSKQSKKAVMDYLKDKDNWLLVFDNLKIGSNRKVSDIVEWEHNGHVIFASQDKQYIPSPIELAVFNKKDTTILANNLLKNKNDVNFLVESFGNYPIAIAQGAKLLNQIKGLDKEVYMKKIYQSTDQIKLNIEQAIKELQPSAINLLTKIALLNNQGFSKNLLKIIADYPKSLDDDIYQLSKFMLVSNIDAVEDNPVFEMHDVIAQKLIEINGDEKNKSYLEEITSRLMNYIPKGLLEGYKFRSEKTISENFEVILKNAEKYNLDIYKIAELKLHLLVQYISASDYYNSDILVRWFTENDQEGKFKLLLMDNDKKRIYGGYLGLIGGYYKKYADYKEALKYYTRAEGVLDSVKGYESYKLNIFYGLAGINISLGSIQDAKKNVTKLDEMLSNTAVDKSDISFIYMLKARLFLIQGKYLEALAQVNDTVAAFINSGVNPNDVLLSNTYLLKTEILNSLEKYQEVYAQTQQLYNMHKAKKKEDHEIFGRIYTQMAKAELGLGDIDKATDHITKALAIFLADEKRNPKNGEVSEDPDLAAGYVVQGDILTARGDIKQAIENYRDAQKIYFYLYKNNSGNIAQVSDLYLKGAKAACKLKDLYHYKAFGLPQVREFGNDHHNTITMFEYCKQHNMDLWTKEN